MADPTAHAANASVKAYFLRLSGMALANCRKMLSRSKFFQAAGLTWVIQIAFGCVGWLWLCNGLIGKTSIFNSATVFGVCIGVLIVRVFLRGTVQGVRRDLHRNSRAAQHDPTLTA